MLEEVKWVIVFDEDSGPLTEVVSLHQPLMVWKHSLSAHRLPFRLFLHLLGKAGRDDAAVKLQNGLQV